MRSPVKIQDLNTLHLKLDFHFFFTTLNIYYKILELNGQKCAHKIKDFLLLLPSWCMSVALAAGGAVLPLNASLCVEKNDLQVCVTDMMVLMIPRKEETQQMLHFLQKMMFIHIVIFD